MTPNEEQLKNLKRKLLDKQNKLESMIFELREMNELLANLPKEKDYSKHFEELNNSILRLTGEINKIKLDKVEVSNIQEAKSEPLVLPEYPTEIKVSNLDEIPVPEINIEEKVIEFPTEFKISNLEDIKYPEINVEEKVIDFPEEFRISNLDEIKQPEIVVEKVEFPEKLNIDWENAPKPPKQKEVNIATPILNLFTNIQNLFQPFFDKVSDFIYNIEQYIKEPTKVIVTKNEITEFYGKKKVVYKIKDDGTKFEITRE